MGELSQRLCPGRVTIKPERLLEPCSERDECGWEELDYVWPDRLYMGLASLQGARKYAFAMNVFRNICGLRTVVAVEAGCYR